MRRNEAYILCLTLKIVSFLLRLLSIGGLSITNPNVKEFQFAKRYWLLTFLMFLRKSRRLQQKLKVYTFEEFFNSKSIFKLNAILEQSREWSGMPWMFLNERKSNMRVDVGVLLKKLSPLTLSLD